jgi:lysophospholipase L1-like esterase
VRAALAAAIVCPLLAQTGTSVPADEPAERTDSGSHAAHQQLLAKRSQGPIDIYFEGDSITRRWGATDYPELLANWKQNFFGWNAADFGWGADTTRNILWRLENGELDDVHPKVIVLLAGTNDLAPYADGTGGDTAVASVTEGIRAILDVMRAKAPEATIILTGIFPRNDHPALMPLIHRINKSLFVMAKGTSIRSLNINNQLAGPDGHLYDGMMNSSDKLHPTVKAYQIWADALKPIFTELLGPPAKEDHAPPATGDPSAQR